MEADIIKMVCPKCDRVHYAPVDQWGYFLNDADAQCPDCGMDSRDEGPVINARVVA